MRNGLPRYWVNTTALSLLVSDTDFSYSGLGPPVSMTRTYNSNSTDWGMFGRGWTFAYDADVTTKTCSITPAVLHQGAGNSLSFDKTSQVCPGGTSNVQVSATPSSPPGNFDKLTYFYNAANKLDYWIHQTKKDFTQFRFDFLLPGAAVPTWLLTSITDRNNKTAQIAHDSTGKISTITDAAGRITSFAYDSQGYCTSMTLPNGKTVHYYYDSAGHLVKTVDLAGNQVLYAYDADGYMVAMTVGSKTTTFAYDASVSPKRLAAVTDAMGHTQTYQRGGIANGNTVTDGLGHASYYSSASNAPGNVCLAAGTGTQDPLGFTTAKSYTNGLLTSYTDSLGWSQSLAYDARGNLTSYQDRPSYNDVTLTYDTNDNVIGMITPVGDAYTFQYDNNHNLTSETFPSGNSETLTYNSDGLLSTHTDALGHQTSFGYDTFGNVTTVIDAIGETWSRAYDSSGILPLSKTDPLGNTTSYTYDDNLRITSITYEDDAVKTFGYDCCSLTHIVDENGNTTTLTRNKLLKPTGITDPMGNTTSYNYDATNTLTGVVKADGSAVSVSPDALYRPAVTTNALGGTRTATYSGNWYPTSLSDERGKATTFSYMDDMPWQTADPLGNTTTTLWDGSRRLWYWGNARSGNNLFSDGILYDYTPDGQLASKQTSANSNFVAQYGYDKARNLINVQDPTGITSYTRDAAKRVTGITYPDAKSATFSYNAVGRLSSVSYPGGVTATYTYNKRNRVASVTWGSNSIALSYDPASNLTQEIRSNGTQTSYVYDKRNLVTQITHAKNAGATTFAQMNYARDALGNTAQESSPVSLLAPTFSSVTMAGTYDDANQIVSFWSDAYAFDADGNLTGISGSRSLNASYDTENRLISLTRSGVTTTYTYNGLGRRTSAVTGSQTVNYYYDHLGRLLFQSNGLGQITAYYIYAGKRLVAMGTPAGGYSFFLYDKTGNTIALTDSSGTVVAAYAYSPFGEILNKTGSIANPFTFVGAYGVMDEGNGVYFMKNRYYDSVTGRFIQKDPIGFKGGQSNLYAYVNNNPVERIDPEGEQLEILVPVAMFTAYVFYEGLSQRTFPEPKPPEPVPLDEKYRKQYEENKVYKGNDPSNGYELWPDGRQMSFKEASEARKKEAEEFFNQQVRFPSSDGVSEPIDTGKTNLVGILLPPDNKLLDSNECDEMIDKWGANH
jgi:RHS repeat-associated protein